LQHAKQLTLLRIEQKYARTTDRLSSSQIAELRQLPLTGLQLKPCTSDTFLKLLALPAAPLLWAYLPYESLIGDDTVSALLPLYLPHLTTLESSDFRWGQITSLAFLPLLPQMRSLSIDLYDHSRHTQQRIGQAMAALTNSLPQLTELDLLSIASTSAQLKTLLSLMPRLSSLVLHDLESLHDLTFLSSVKNTLRTLILQNCTHSDFTPRTLLQLQDMSLHTIELSESLSQPLDDLSLALFMPPSRLLPTLQSFLHTARVEFAIKSFFFFFWSEHMLFFSPFFSSSSPITRKRFYKKPEP
jgi:hypothetical protein